MGPQPSIAIGRKCQLYGSAGHGDCLMDDPRWLRCGASRTEPWGYHRQSIPAKDRVSRVPRWRVLTVPNGLAEGVYARNGRLDAIVFSSYGASAWSLAAWEGQKMEVAGGIEPP